MKLKTILSVLLILAVSVVSAQIEAGKVYRIKNAFYSKYVQEHSISHIVTCDAINEKEKYTQMWIAEGDNGKFALQNVYTGRYIIPKEGFDKVYDTSSSDAFWFEIFKNSTFPNYYNIRSFINSERFMTCAYSGDVLAWLTNGDGYESPTFSEWSFEEVAITQDEIDEARRDYASLTQVAEDAERYYIQFSELFTDYSCSELKPTYKAMSDEELLIALEGFPQVYIELALKIKNNTWESYEKEFRVATYKPYSDAYNWGGYLKTNPYSILSSPTGITCEKGEVLLVFVDKQISYPSMLYLEEIKGNEIFSSGTTELKQGLNVITVESGGTLFVNYKVETDRSTESRLLSDYPNVNIHIEGGTLNGYFDKSRHTNEDWVNMQKSILKHEIINVKGEHALFHMHRDKVIAVCPNNIYESIDWWDTIVEWEKELMGATQYADRWNNPMLCVDGEGQYMFATNYYTYYEYSTLKDILPWDKVKNNPGYAWGPAHEIGHMNQGAINIVSCTEVSNNLFANVVVHRMGKSTTRGVGMGVCYDDWQNNIPYPLRSEVFSKTRMYFQLYLYFHEAKHDTTFYPRLFEYLRDTPLSSTSGVNGKFNQLRFAEACC
ncbi:MAG: M60 family metallopeptidase [Bacteroidaceae bacterium]|nr:M60 family metallopeptidase [Bacteroidaceae bacterium]